MADIHATPVAQEDVHAVTVRRIASAELWTALQRGLDDLWAMPTFIVFGALIYPVVGLVLGRIALGTDFVQLLFPIVSGFALVGPVAGLWLYELSRRREAGLDTSIGSVFGFLRTRAMPGVLVLGALLTLTFLSWLMLAEGLYQWLFGDVLRLSLSDFAARVLATPRGWLLLALGHLIGFAFAAFAFAISVVSFPMILDRRCGAPEAMYTSLRAVAANPGPMALWAATIAALLVLGSLPLFFGLAIVVPVLAHASWHLYRMMVVP